MGISLSDALDIPANESTTSFPDSGIIEGKFTTSEVVALAEKSVDFLAALAMPDIFKYFWPPLYISAWNWLLSFVNKERDFSQLVLGLPRGFAKTTFVKLFLLYVILYTKKKFILVMSENQGKADNIVADVISMLTNINVRRAFGDWRLSVEKDTQQIKKFVYRGRVIVLMAGTVETARGLNLNNERPDIMVFDDIQSRICAESQIQSETLEREMIGTAMKAKSPHGCLFIFVGNMYPTKWSILKKLKKNPNWVKFIVGGILSDGTSLWEQLQPIKQLLKEFENDMLSGHPEIFAAEVLNDENASLNNLIDLTRLPVYPFKDDDIAGGNFIVIDPSGDTSNSDAVSIGYFEVHDTLDCLIEHVEDRLSPGATIHKAIEIALRRRCRLVVVEGTAYQSSLSYWAKHICDQMGLVGIEFVEIYPGSFSKNSRILNFMKSYAKGEIYVHPRSQPAVHLQITQFNPLKKNNTDGLLDLLAYAPRVKEMYGEFVIANSIIEHMEFSSTRVLERNSPF